MSFRTPMARAADITHDWFVVDASDRVLGRLATEIARVLSGKHRPGWVPHLDSGDFVIVTHAEKVRLTGRKGDEKVYRRHSGYPGGLKSVGAPEMRAKYPERLIEEAVRGMLPKTKLGRRVFKKLKVYRGASHPHQAQRPKPLGRVAAAKAKA
jgi:large subunit ribosomal protein L13